MQDIIDALAEQQAELACCSTGIDAVGMGATRRARAGRPSDVVVHLAQTDELASGAARAASRGAGAVERRDVGCPVESTTGVALMVERERRHRAPRRSTI